MRRLGLRVVECLAKDFHRVCSKLRCEHKQVAPQPLSAPWHHFALRPSRQWPASLYLLLLLSHQLQHNRSDWLQTRGHQHWAQPSACKLPDQSYGASRVPDKVWIPADVVGRSLLLPESQCPHAQNGEDTIMDRTVCLQNSYVEALALNVMVSGDGPLGGG